MKTFISYFFSVDIRLRAAILLSLIIVLFWWILGKVIIHFISFFPYLLRGIFKGIYLLIEAPVCWIHTRTGSFFYKIDNGLAGIGNKIDAFLGRWYRCWRNPESRHIFLSIAIYCILVIWICIPYHVDESDTGFVSGQIVYLNLENKLIYWLETHNLYKENTEEIMAYNEGEQVKDGNITNGIMMKVITQKDPLSIRDIPSLVNCVILESVEKENTVFWKGDMTFGSGRNGGIEPWIKVETLDGTVGWARLIYLCPADEEDFELKLYME